MKTSFSALLLLDEAASFSPAAIEHQIRMIGGRLVQSVQITGNEGDQTLLVALNSVQIAVMSIPMPAPGFSNYRSDGPNLLWPGVEADLARHKAHVSVVAGGEVEGRELSIALATAVTLISAAILTLTKPIGVYWPVGENFVTAEAFLGAASGFGRGEGLPVMAWVRLYAARADVGGIIISTRGLAPYAGRELDFAPSMLDLGALMQNALSISHYLISSGVAFKDGETIGPDGEASFAITLQGNGRMKTGPVYGLAEPD